ncbi:MAG: hypothetical protein WBQ60_10895 [Asticcacaulis sp.]
MPSLEYDFRTRIMHDGMVFANEIGVGIGNGEVVDRLDLARGPDGDDSQVFAGGAFDAITGMKLIRICRSVRMIFCN